MRARSQVVAGILVLAIFVSPGASLGQTTANQPSHPASAANGTKSQPREDSQPADMRSWIVRDPLSGRLFQQYCVSTLIPTTQWESKPITTTVYEPKVVVKDVPRQLTVYTPTTQYAMQPRLRGWWNPLRQPVQSYSFVPLTSWHPQTQKVNTPTSTVQWVPRKQVVYVPQPVQRMHSQQQIVTREIPQPGLAAPAGRAMLAAQRPPLITIPLLARQRILPWQTRSASTTMSNIVNSGLRPIASVASSDRAYPAALQTASSSGGRVFRDTTQSGMAATVLR